MSVSYVKQVLNDPVAFRSPYTVNNLSPYIYKLHGIFCEQNEGYPELAREIPELYSYFKKYKRNEPHNPSTEYSAACISRVSWQLMHKD